MLLPPMKDLLRQGRFVVAALLTLAVVAGPPLEATAAAPPAGYSSATGQAFGPIAAKHHRKRHGKSAGKRYGHKQHQASKKPQPPKGAPPEGFVPRSGSLFSYPNRSAKERFSIRRTVLHTIRSTWGGPRDRNGAAAPGNGTIRIATWSFNDKTIARALWRAHRRGVSVQLTAAAGANKQHRAWHWLRDKLHGRLSARHLPRTIDGWSFARKCKGSCRGHGGTTHAKYFLFTNVGPTHVRNITIQTSMNLTRMAYMHQWNQATITWGRRVHHAFGAVFAEARHGDPVRHPYRRFSAGRISNIFFPRPHATPAEDPVMQSLHPVRCRGAARGRTRIRVIQYAIYGQRGLGLARRLRQLWNRGCDIRIIYSITSGPVLAILRSPYGRGPIPMRQSVIRNRLGQLAVYNHSKWMTIEGAYGKSRAASLVLAGSPNWSDLALSSDEQLQLISGRRWVPPYLHAFEKTWRQRSSKLPYGWGASFRMALPQPSTGEPVFGEGELAFAPED